MSLEIESALRQLLARSSDCVWRHDVEGYGQCWAREGQWHIMGEVVHGREAIAERWWSSMERYTRVWQESHNIVFDLDGEHPVARLYLEEHLITEDNPAKILKGVYHDTYTFEDGAWRFAVRHVDIAYIGPPDLSGQWNPMIDHGPAPHDPDPQRPATPVVSK